MDLIPNPHHEGLTRQTTFPVFALIVDHKSRFVFFEGMDDYTTDSCIQILNKYTAMLQNKGLISKLCYLRADAGSCFTSSSFISWAEENNINVSLAAPRYQEQNSIVERAWQTLHYMAASMLVHAHVSNSFYYHAHKYASHLMNTLPAKNLYNKNDVPTTPFFMMTGKKSMLGHFRIFGCPTV